MRELLPAEEQGAARERVHLPGPRERSPILAVFRQLFRQYARVFRTARGLVSGRAWKRSAMTVPVRRAPARAVIALLICRAVEIEKPWMPLESARLSSASTIKWR